MHVYRFTVMYRFESQVCCVLSVNAVCNYLINRCFYSDVHMFIAVAVFLFAKV